MHFWNTKQNSYRTEIAAILAICDCDAHRGPQNRSDFQDKRNQCCIAIWGCDGKVASDSRFRIAMSEPETPSFCGISGDLAHSTRKSLAISIEASSAASFPSAFVGLCARFPHASPGRLSWRESQENTQSGEGKVLVFFWVWPFNMHAPYILSADDLDDISGIL